MKISFRLVLALIVLLAAALMPALSIPRESERMAVQSIVILLVLYLVIRELMVRPVQYTAEAMKNLRLGHTSQLPPPLPREFFEPLSQEIGLMAESLVVARAAAEKEAKLRYSADSLWTAERLKEHVRSKLQNRPLFVISNREPYMHVRRGNTIDYSVPPSGLVTALEPILRACGGLWIAQGTGDADREVVDAQDKIRVPPDGPHYTLRRVWVTPEEDQGFYYGFANEGLWPLCHIAHTRPLFRPEDWAHYLAVNERFAQVALEEMQGAEEPYVLVQDYHFALLPQIIKEKRPDARVALFWHIPWPNPESFGICPWRQELLKGMLGADLLGFHIQQHCNNFLDTVDRTLESRIDWERFAVLRQGHATWVRPFPISVAFAPVATVRPPARAALPDREAFLRELGIRARFLGVGVDRIDYTKGIVERFRGIEKLLEQYPEYRGEFTFVELAAPSRTLIPRYQDVSKDIHAEAQRINERFQVRDWRPILVLEKQHTHKDVEVFYKMANVCLVTSLHDGMNLVAKEFVAARDDEDGVLILSPFTGAARELRDALIANPYDVEQLANALNQALGMSEEERQGRMRRMRQVVRDQNIYRWGANLISELAHIRIQAAPAPASASTSPWVKVG